MDTSQLQQQITDAAEGAAERVGAGATELRHVVAARAHELSDAAREAALEAREAALEARARMVEEEPADEGSNTFLLILLVLGLAGLVAYLLKRKREQELDEALWEEPRAL